MNLKGSIYYLNNSYMNTCTVVEYEILQLTLNFVERYAMVFRWGPSLCRLVDHSLARPRTLENTMRGREITMRGRDINIAHSHHTFATSHRCFAFPMYSETTKTRNHDPRSRKNETFFAILHCVDSRRLKK
jgi:hypothetical protein